MLLDSTIKGAALIDRSSPMPAYQQIATSLMNRISEGEWAVGERIPPEGELAEDYEVSLITMRQALQQLERGGIIRKYQGKGIFIESYPSIVVQDLSFPKPGSPRRSLPSRLLVLERRPPNRIVNSKLGVGENAPLVYLQRLFLQEETAIGINNAWFPDALLPGLAEAGLEHGSITKTLAKHGFTVSRIENSIAAVKLDAANAKLLDVPYDSAALKIESVSLLADGTPVEFASTLWVGDTVRFHHAAENKDREGSRP